jgi:hypothetical protein
MCDHMEPRLNPPGLASGHLWGTPHKRVPADSLLAGTVHARPSLRSIQPLSDVDCYGGGGTAPGTRDRASSTASLGANGIGSTPTSTAGGCE